MTSNHHFSHEWRDDATPLPHSIGRFQVLARAGGAAQGSQATVFKGRDPRTGQEVAIKVIGDPFDSFEGSILASLLGPSAMEELQREARVLSTLDHPNIVHVLETGDDSVYGAYLVTEWASGGDLRARLGRAGQGGLPLDQALAVARDLLSALGAAHAAGILHRDVKPENVVCDEDGRARLTDFGIAIPTGRDSPSALAGRGTPAYMAPEQHAPPAQGRVGPPADLYAVGLILFEMLAGRLPTPGEDMRSSLPGVPGAIVRVIARALQQESHHRFQSAREMAAALEDA